MPSEQTPRSGRSEWTAVLVVAIGLMIGCSVMLALPIGFFAPVILLGALLFTGLVGFHYLVWGRWLTRIIEQEKASDDEPK